jgi:hypothetical protein
MAGSFRSMESLAVYTTIYPGVKDFLADWYDSVRRQTDRDFHLWIGLDSLDIDSVEAVVGDRIDATWVSGAAGDTPAQVRQRAWEQIVSRHEGVVLVDSDDVLHPTRVQAARAALRSAEVVGCALRLVDRLGADLHMIMRVPDGTAPMDILPRRNLYGLSNTAYRCDVLGRCLPVPTDVVHVDWFLATRAWLSEAVLTFDSVVRMDYRQHGANMAQIRGPFTADRVLTDTVSVRHHFDILKASVGTSGAPDRLALLEQVATDVDAFYQHMAMDPERLDRYVRALNSLGPSPIWWSHVAHPSLRELWMNRKESV